MSFVLSFDESKETLIVYFEYSVVIVITKTGKVIFPGFLAAFHSFVLYYQILSICSTLDPSPDPFHHPVHQLA
jgi:hypothetical protein